jgi:hypothetical protein
VRHRLSGCYLMKNYDSYKLVPKIPSKIINISR